MVVVDGEFPPPVFAVFLRYPYSADRTQSILRSVHIFVFGKINTILASQIRVQPSPDSSAISRLFCFSTDGAAICPTTFQTTIWTSLAFGWNRLSAVETIFFWRWILSLLIRKPHRPTAITKYISPAVFLCTLRTAALLLITVILSRTHRAMITRSMSRGKCNA